MFRLLVSQPIPVLLLIVTLVGFSTLALIRLVVRLIARGKKPLDISSPLSGMAATAFVFIAALLSSQIQGDVSTARQSLYHEAAALQMIRLYAEVLPAADQAVIGRYLQEYVSLVVTDEWKRMQHEGENRAVRTVLSNLLRQVHEVAAQDIREALRTAVNDLINARVERLRIAADTVPAITWIVLFCLGVFTKFAVALNHGDHHQWQRVVGVTVTMLMGLIFIMMLVYDQPYARPDIVSPKTLIEALQ